MKNKRKIVSPLLAFSLIFGLILAPKMTASAESTSKYLKINSTVLEFQQIVYVNGTDGNDTSGDGSKPKPFKTVTKGFDYMNTNCREGGAIVLEDGTYDVSELFQGNSYNLSAKYNEMDISLLAENMGRVKFTNFMEIMLVDNSPSQKIKVDFYGIIFASLKNSGYCLGGDALTNEYYNCSFVGGYGGWNGFIENASIKTENCLFTGNPNEYYSKNPLSGSAINCASTTKYIDPCSGTKTNVLYNVTIDSEYNIISDGWKNTGTGTNPDGTVANIGVYGGQFSWGSTVEEISNNNKLKVVLETKETVQLSVDDDLEENTNIIWVSSDSSVAKVDSNGIVTALKPGNTVVTVTNSNGTYTDYVNILVVDNAEDYRLAVDLKIGSRCRLTVDDLKNTEIVTWASLNPEIATVTNKGKVKAVSKGLTIITATDSTGKEIGQIYVRIRI